jgi:hypothetical protein
MASYAEAIEGALADPDPWHGFRGYIEHVCQMQADDRAFAAVLTMTFPSAKVLEEDRRRTSEALAPLLVRAKATGHCVQTSPTRTYRWCSWPPQG